MNTNRKAGITVAAHATSPADCGQLLDMLGLRTELAPAPAPEPSPTPSPKPTRRRGGPGRPTVDHGHGHYLTYAKGCRCDDCREAHRIKSINRRAAWKRDPAAADRAGHGKTSTYKNYGCRCTPCTTAHTVEIATRRARRRTGAGSRG